MKNRILSIALALSMLVVAAYALTVSASVTYTGSVTTTDNLGAPKDLFFRGDPVYVNVELLNDGAPFNGAVTVQLVRTTDGWVASSFTRNTNNPVVGWYNSSGTGVSLWSGAGFLGDTMTYDVVEWYSGVEVARHPIIVKATGLTLQPGSSPFEPYYPSETVAITLVTTRTATGFYVQVVNSTGDTLFNITQQIAWTGWWSYDWTIADNFPDGMFTMNVRDATTHATWYSANLWVQKYVLTVSPDRTYYLIGETAMINYAVFDASSMAPYSGVNITFSATWLNLTGNQTWLNDSLVGTSGTQEFLIPASVNLSSNVDITYWANETGTARSYQVDLTLYTGLLSATVTVGASSYLPGELVVVTVTARAGWSNLPGAKVDLSIERNSTNIAAYGATNMITDFLGSVTHTFRLDAGAVQGSYIVNVTVSKVSYSVNRMTTFRVVWDGALIVHFDKTSYYGGDVAEVTFRTIWNGEELTGKSVAYYVSVSYGILTTGNTSGNSAQVPIPTDYYGPLSIHASVNINGNILDTTVSTTVNFASIVVTTDKSNYRQGETLTFHYDIVTSLTTANLEYEVTDNDGVTVAQGSPAFSTSGSFELVVPSENPPTSYTAKVVMTTGSGGYLTSSVTVYIMDNYELQIWLEKSGYTSGEYRPGQTVKVHYTINTYQAKLPVYKIVLYTSLDPMDHTYLVTDTSGVVEYTIPANAPSAIFEMDADLYNPISGAHLYGTGGLFTVNSELGSWDKSVGGMSAIDFTLLVLIVIMILLLIIVPFLKGRMGGEKPAKVETPPPPAEPPKP